MDAIISKLLIALGTSFNPRARDGRDFNDLAAAAGLNVSIHAPVMDAINNASSIMGTVKFQSTRP